MAPLDRFLKIEERRPLRPGEPRQVERTRFAEVGGGAGRALESQRSGAEAERFAPAPERPADAPIRVREDDGGQPFIRCRECRYDNPLGATACTFCDADLTTPGQREFNQALWDRYLQERAEHQQEAERLAAEQRSQEAVLRHWQVQWRVATPGSGSFNAAGRVIAGWLVRTFPDRRQRVWVVVGVLAVVNLLSLWWVLSWQVGLAFWWVPLAIQILALLSARPPARRG